MTTTLDKIANATRRFARLTASQMHLVARDTTPFERFRTQVVELLTARDAGGEKAIDEALQSIGKLAERARQGARAALRRRTALTALARDIRAAASSAAGDAAVVRVTPSLRERWLRALRGAGVSRTNPISVDVSNSTGGGVADRMIAVAELHRLADAVEASIS